MCISIHLLVIFRLENRGFTLVVLGKLENKKKETIALDTNNFILRGCSLKNTKWIIGCVAYTGYLNLFVFG